MPARVKVHIGYKVNMGNYETINFDFGIEDDIRPDEKSADTFDRLYEWVFSRLDAEVEKARKAARG